jgi:hypothetical protein
VIRSRRGWQHGQRNVMTPSLALVGAVELGLGGARCDGERQKMMQRRRSFSPRVWWLHGSSGSFSRWEAPLLQAQQWRRHRSSGPLAPVILPSAVAQLGEPPVVVGLVRQASRKKNVGGKSRRKQRRDLELQWGH